MGDVDMETAIKVSNLGKNFHEKNVLENIDFEVKLGEMVAITGKSGRGKSTLLNIIGLIMDKSKGDIWHFNKKKVKRNSYEGMLLKRNRIGYLFQNYGLVEEETVYWNLNLALEYKKMKKSQKKKQISEILQYIGLGDTEKYPVYKLSGGEQQRVAMARIILQGSDLILVDEPTGSLDGDNRDMVISLLAEMKKRGKAVLIVTHDPYIAEKCDRTIQL